MSWIGGAIVVAGIGAGLGVGGSYGAFVNAPGLLFVGLVGGGTIVFAHGLRSLAVLGRAITGTIYDAERRPAQAVAETGRKAFVASGWIGFIIGVVQMLSTLDDPSHLGAGASVALLTVLYGYCIGDLLMLPLSQSLENCE